MKLKLVKQAFVAAGKDLLNTLEITGMASIVATGVGFGLAFGIALFKLVLGG